MKKTILHCIPVFLTAFLVFACCVISPLSVNAQSIVSGDSITWDGEITSNSFQFDYEDGHMYLELVSPSVPSLDILTSSPNVVTYRFLDTSGYTSVESETNSPVISVGDHVLGIGMGTLYPFVFFADADNASANVYGTDVVFPNAGTYFMYQIDVTAEETYIVTELRISGFTFEPLGTPELEPEPPEGIYFDIYNTLHCFIYGTDTELTTAMELTLTIVSTAACLFAFALPFLIVWLIIRKLVV